MKEFFKFTLATILGLLVTGFIFMIIGIASVAGLLASSETETTVHNNSVFVLDLQGSIAERYQPTPIDQLLDEEQSVYGLNDISASIAKAKENDQIKGIYLNVGNFSCGSASLQEIRQALADFKESGKFIIAYGGGYSQSGYYLASIADKIILNPSGSISWHGLSAQTLFVKDLLKKVGINVQIFRVGTYKSAVEPLIGTEMSPANKEQTQAFVQSIWNQMTDDIAQSRQLTQEQLNILADQYMDFQPADSCIANGLADTLMYKDEVLAYLKSQIGLKEKDKLHTLILSDMINVKRNTPRDKSGNIIAVYYAYGEIDNLQRGGSDYTASLIGAAVNASEIQIWTDIDGMHDNDPRIVDKTSPVRQLHFEEAAELAYFGAKILHPTCVQPAKYANIPVRLLNTMEPTAPGTLISNETEKGKIKAVAAKDNITAIKIKSSRMLLAHGFLRKVFEIFESYQTAIDMVCTSEVGVSMSIDNTKHLNEIVDDLKKYGTVTVDHDMCIVCVVGDLEWENVGFEAKALDAMRDIPVRMISFGGSNYNISFLIREADKKKALQSLSDALFNNK